MQPSRIIANKGILDIGNVEKDLTVLPKPYNKIDRWKVLNLVLTLAEFIVNWDKPIENSKNLRINGGTFKLKNINKKNKSAPHSVTNVKTITFICANETDKIKC